MDESSLAKNQLQANVAISKSNELPLVYSEPSKPNGDGNSNFRSTKANSIISSNRASEPIKSQWQITKFSACLLGIISILILIILALLVSNRVTPEASALSYTEGSKLIHDGSGRLLAAGSDQHGFPANEPLDDQSDDTDEDDSFPPTGSRSDHLDQNYPQFNQVPKNPAFKLDSRSQASRSSANHKTSSNVKLRDPDEVCLSPGCIKAAAQIINNMDNSTNPCDNFYQFACGRWIATQIIPDEKTSLSVFSQNTADLNIKLRALIEAKNSKQIQDPPIVGQMRNLYTSCMNLSEIESRGDEPLLEVLRNLGGWPVLHSQSSPVGRSSVGSRGGANLQASTRRNPRNEVRSRRRAIRQSSIASTSSGFDNLKDPSWLDLLVKFRERGFSHDMIIDLSVVVDIRNNRRYVVELDQASLGLPDRSYYFKSPSDSTVSAYFGMMVDSAVMLGADRGEARRQMQAALEFERSLAKISLPREQRRNVSSLYNKMPARNLYSLAPNIDWQRYLSSLLSDDQFDLDRDEVIVKVPNFIRALDELLLQADPIVVANYMIWRVVRLSMGALSRKWRELVHSYSTIVTGRQIEEPRWETCLGSLEGTLATALSALYVKNHFNQRSKKAALQMVDYIRAEFLKILDEVNWMDEETRKEAKLKAQGIAPYIGYPDELLDEHLVEEHYAGLKLTRENYYQNLRALRIWSTNYAFNQLRRPNKRGDWKKHAKAAVVNAFYSSLENSIEFPAGILRGTFFDSERPNYMNFGAIGYIIGHEITHGFDDRGRQFDREGQDRNWWNPKTDNRFRERAQCIIDQYSNYTLDENGLNVNGLNTQGENIADNGGIKQAFRAYRRWTKDFGREMRLPGLNLSPDQLFWVSAANIWCGKFRPEVLKLRINSGVHSPAKFRIIGPFSNAPEFSQSFNCPLGAPMNPKRKCTVW